MGKERRYVVTIEAYVYADSDESARMKAHRYANKLNELDDCRPSVSGLCEQPFGSFGNRKIAV
jgi:hypothetical protein